MNPLGVFEVDHNIDYPLPDMVPFDTYGFTATVFVIEKGANKSVPIAGFTAGEATDNFVISSSGFHTKNHFTYDSGAGPATTDVKSAVIEIIARRSKLAQAFTLCLLLINWALTTASIYITVLVVSRKEKVEAAVLLLPVTIVLTIPTLRNVYVGSPPFGVYIGEFWALKLECGD